MKLRVLTTAGDELDYEISDDAVGLLEFPVRGQDPELPARHWLSDLLSIEVSEHPVPMVQTFGEPPAEVEFDESIYAADGQRVGKQKLVKRRVPPALLPKGLREPFPGSPRAPRLPKKTKRKEPA